MKIAELREALGFLELDTSGKKAVLAARLLEALYPSSASAEPAEPAEPAEEAAVEEPEPVKARGRGNKRASIDEAEPPAAVARPKRAKTAQVVEEEAPKRHPKRELAAEPAAAPQRASRSRR